MIWHGLKSGTIMITSDSVLVHPLSRSCAYKTFVQTDSV